ncbi:MAG: hypothetical protein FJW20_00010 [Acidimicrobiia bacterium]|nr:hypothetical protein [Acidimicrobiia bacterium]
MVALDRRNQERQEAAGDVTLILDHELEVSATLRDQSDSGFRAAHHYILLESGQEVQYRIGTREGKARVVWCRIGSGGCESGFYIL